MGIDVLLLLAEFQTKPLNPLLFVINDSLSYYPKISTGPMNSRPDLVSYEIAFSDKGFCMKFRR